jgi:hypothetical protein
MLKAILASHALPDTQALSAVPFAVKPLPGFLVDYTWNVPSTLTFVDWVLVVRNDGQRSQGSILASLV